jgi:hypothetical protein
MQMVSAEFKSNDPTQAINSNEATVIRHLVPNAKKTIVHLYLIHPVKENLASDQVPFAEKIALEQYKLAEKILDGGKLQLFYGDSLDSNLALSMNESFGVKRPFFTIPNELKVNPQFMLLYTGRKVGGAEDLQIVDDFQQKLFLTMRNSNASSSKQSEMAHDREIAIIKNLMVNKSNVDLLVLGASHRLLPEVQAWNKAHPKNSISLIEVIPKSIPPNLKELDKWQNLHFPNYGR